MNGAAMLALACADCFGDAQFVRQQDALKERSVVKLFEILEDTFRQAARKANAQHLKTSHSTSDAANHCNVRHHPILELANATRRVDSQIGSRPVEGAHVKAAVGGLFDAARVGHGFRLSEDGRIAPVSVVVDAATF